MRGVRYGPAIDVWTDDRGDGFWLVSRDMIDRKRRFLYIEVLAFHRVEAEAIRAGREYARRFRKPLHRLDRLGRRSRKPIV